MDKKQFTSWGVSFASIALVGGMVSYLGIAKNGTTNKLNLASQAQGSTQSQAQSSQTGNSQSQAQSPQNSDNQSSTPPLQDGNGQSSSQSSPNENNQNASPSLGDSSQSPSNSGSQQGISQTPPADNTFGNSHHGRFHTSTGGS